MLRKKGTPSGSPYDSQYFAGTEGFGSDPRHGRGATDARVRDPVPSSSAYAGHWWQPHTAPAGGEQGGTVEALEFTVYSFELGGSSDSTELPCTKFVQIRVQNGP